MHSNLAPVILRPRIPPAVPLEDTSPLKAKELNEEMKILKKRQNQEVYDFLSQVEQEERRLKDEIAESRDEPNKKKAAKDYADFNSKVQQELKKIMHQHKKELEDLAIIHH